MYFQQGRLTLGKICIGPQKGHPRTRGMDLICTMPRLHLLGRGLIWPGHFGASFLGLFGLYPWSLSKSAVFFSLSGKASLVSISDAILFLRSQHVYFSLDFEFRGKSQVGKGACRPRCHLMFPTLCNIVQRVNLNKLSRDFVGELRTTTTNCRVSFIDLYLVFPTNFGTVFLHHTNGAILLEPYCGTFTVDCEQSLFSQSSPLGFSFFSLASLDFLARVAILIVCYTAVFSVVTKSSSP